MFSTKHTVFAVSALVAAVCSAAVKELGLDAIYLRSPSFGNPSIHLDFTGNIAPDELQGKVEFFPPVKVTKVAPYYSWSSFSTDDVRIDGEFQPGQTYEMIIRRGLASTEEGFKALSYDIVRVLEFPDREQSVSLELSGSYLAPEADINLPIATMNMDEVTVRAETVLPQNIVM